MAHVTAREQVRMCCCGRRWVGVDRAHCCRRTAGCGHVFDDVALWDGTGAVDAASTRDHWT